MLYLQLPQSAAFPEYMPLDTAITKYVDSSTAAGNAAAVGVYFRDLNSNEWFAVNPTVKFSPASMLKVATLISIFRVAESFPPLLTGSITVQPSVDQAIDSQDYFPAANPITPGKTYSVENLLQHLIIDSDNNANTLLNKYMGETEINTTLSDLGIPIPDENGGDSDTPQQYSRLFRVLYNATYLSPYHSEQALALLSRTTFTQGLVAGVPADTVVSHKFGERTFLSPVSSLSTAAPHELHDCGIIYYPDHPYFLCVMTKGADFPTLEGVIRDISQITWSNLSAKYSK